MRVLQPVSLLRMEAACVFFVSLALYQHQRGNWLVFALAFFAPDVAIPVYAWSRSAGWRLYNLTHSYATPFLLLLVLLLATSELAALVLIWFAHIAWDRMLAFGLKQGEDFWDTHLGRIVAGRRLWERVTAAVAGTRR